MNEERKGQEAYEGNDFVKFSDQVCEGVYCSNPIPDELAKMVIEIECTNNQKVTAEALAE